MADPKLVKYAREHLKKFGAPALRERLLADGIDQAEVEAALMEASAPPKPRPRLALYALGGGAALLILAVLLSMEKSPPQNVPAAQGSGEDGGVFEGHYGYVLQLPKDYTAVRSFGDASDSREIVHLCPRGTDPQHFLHEGLYGHFGILRLEVSPRRVPQGWIDLKTLQAFIETQLKREKADYQVRPLAQHGMSGFLVSIKEPFPAVRAHLVGEKVRYTLLGAEENDVFTRVLSSLVEVGPGQASP